MKYLKYIQYAFLAIGFLTVLSLFVMDDDAAVGLMLNWAYILLGLTIAAAVILPLINLIKNPGGAVRSLMGLGVIVVVLGVCFALSSDAPVITPVNSFTDPVALRLSDAGLYSAYIALAAAIIVVLFGEIRNSFK